MLAVVRTGLMSLSATPLIQASLTTAVSAQHITLRVTANLDNKHKKQYDDSL